MINIDIYSTRAVIRSQEPLTVGMVGGKVKLHFSDPWKNLTRTVVFRQGDVTKDMVGVTDETRIPWEVLQVPGMPVQIGVYGSDSAGSVIIPTMWVETDPVQEGADPSGDPSTEATLPVYQQIQGRVDKNTPFIVQITGDENTGYEADALLVEIHSARNAGRPVMAKYAQRILPLVWIDTNIAQFCSVFDRSAFMASVTNTDVKYSTRLVSDNATVDALGKTVADHTTRIEGQQSAVSELQKTTKQHTIKLNAQQNAIDGHTDRLAKLEAGGIGGGTSGADGVSCTHAWNGTVLTVTSASGTSSADLKGAKGDTGEPGAKGEKGETGSQGIRGEQGIPGADGYTPVKGVDYYTDGDKAEFSAFIANELAKRGQLKPEFAESPQWLNENGDTTKLYVLPDSEIYAYMLTEKEVATGGYDNRLEKATETYNGTAVYGEKGYMTGVRLSSSGSVSTSSATEMLATGFISAPDGGSLDGARIRTVGFVPTTSPMAIYVISYNASGAKINHKDYSSDKTYINDFTLDSATYGTNIKYIRISTSINGTSPSAVTVNEEIKESSSTIVKDYGWTSTGHTFVPADYEDRIVDLETEVEALNSQITTLNQQVKHPGAARLSVTEVFAPSPQLPADGSETADFNGDKNQMTPEQIYAYIDTLLNQYPRFITKEVMGKDASGKHDWCRYTLCKRGYDAWQVPNYPPMYGWVNGSETVYSRSVSPRIGDMLYTTPYVGTEKGAVTAVSNANQSRTVGGVAYTRDSTKDVAPTLVFTETAYSPYFSENYAGFRNGIYSSGKAKISTVASMADGVLTGANGISYTRYPLGDRSSRFETIPAIVIGGNEHGTGGDPATPAMINARMIMDLCQCKNANNPFLNLLKNEYMMVFCPVVNPWGLHKDNQNYRNSNGVNLDRNFDTPGWVPQDQEPDGWNTGAYGGSENETQYFMNTLAASGAKIAMCNHSYGEGLDYDMPAENREAVSGGICSYMFGGYKPQYADGLLKIGEVMAANYNLLFCQNSNIATPDQFAKTRSYFEHMGIDGVALEMNSRDGFITDPNNQAQGKQFTARVMEAAYTQLLQVLWMLINGGAS